MPIDQQAYRDLVLGRKKGLGPAMLRGLLWVCSVPYGLVVRGRNLFFQWGWKTISTSPLPVISVGNLTVGGTGKTPMVAWLAAWLREKNIRVAILSRGYAASEGVNDEALVLEETLGEVPHLQDRDRVNLAKIAELELDMQALVLDDGFQHRKLGRSLDVVLIDALDPWGGGRLLPAGLLREPISSLRRADAIVLTRCDAVDEAINRDIRQRACRHQPHAVWAEVRFAPTGWIRHDHPTEPVERLRNAKVLAFAGVGNPMGFFHTLRALPAELIDTSIFADHHAYTADDIAQLRAWTARHQPEAVVCTHKDLVKIRLAELAGVPLYALSIGAQFEAGQEALEDLLQRQIVDQLPIDG